MTKRKRGRGKCYYQSIKLQKSVNRSERKWGGRWINWLHDEFTPKYQYTYTKRIIIQLTHMHTNTIVVLYVLSSLLSQWKINGPENLINSYMQTICFGFYHSVNQSGVPLYTSIYTHVQVCPFRLFSLQNWLFPVSEERIASPGYM